MSALHRGPRDGYAPVRDRRSDDGDALDFLDRELCCSVRLQVFLYFSFWYDVLFAALHLAAGWYKWRWIRGGFLVALLGLNLFLAFVIEPFRLYLGYAGNLGEKVPHLLLFSFLCVIPCAGLLIAEIVLSSILPELQPPACSSLKGKPCILPIEKACWIVQSALLLAELYLGVQALRRLIHEQSRRFFMSLDSMDVRQSGSLDDSTLAGSMLGPSPGSGDLRLRRDHDSTGTWGDAPGRTPERPKGGDVNMGTPGRSGGGLRAGIAGSPTGRGRLSPPVTPPRRGSPHLHTD
eukprot:gnl/TRDRNA2_/TRDRNA2_30073_c0_seq1.p1 gnl/TRDRNA2_/TRDRNA2_30073_c0~~gnl/TRDRNA2_/TRDRNA2_30073_c0_seq1.p1  ORF type:complete len:292 (-),score=39.88 gnl/TRDRNA2_/TRDRNA2_30073_c0_seq1:49-924(-)